LTTPKLVEHFFRHEYGRLVATLSRRVGVRYIEDVEDAVQSALMTTLETWTITDLRDNPPAWLFRVAHNNLMGELRRRTGRRRILEQNVKGDIGTLENGPEIFLAGEVPDDLLRTLFVCYRESFDRAGPFLWHRDRNRGQRFHSPKGFEICGVRRLNPIGPCI
jgi:predicted RNA polymerase sigma factor